jgi:hypothetical protein
MWYKTPDDLWKILSPAKGKRYFTLFTLDTYPKPSACGGIQIVSKDKPNKYYLVFHTYKDGKPATNWPEVTLMPNQWVHVAFTYDGQYAETYMNGQLLTKVDRGNGELDEADTLWIGSYFWSNAVDGVIDSVRVLTKAIKYRREEQQ